VTKEQVRNSPSIDTDRPISRQYENSYLGYYGYPYYWGGPALWGEWNHPGTLRYDRSGEPYGNYQGYLRSPSSGKTNGDPHLRSCSAVKGYHIRARGEEIGHVQGFLLDDATWSVRYLIVNTSNWWMGHQVLVSPEWIKSVDWPEATVTVDLDRQAIKDAPAYDPDSPIARDSEENLHGHYGRRGHWHEPPARAVA
jgi:hypothetical protein